MRFQRLCQQERDIYHELSSNQLPYLSKSQARTAVREQLRKNCRRFGQDFLNNLHLAIYFN